MSTHTGKCVVCSEVIYCSSDSHVLGAGRGCYCDGDVEGQIEFCSLECFCELQKSMAERLEIAKELYPDWFKRYGTATAFG